MPPSTTLQTIQDLDVDLVVRSIPRSHVPLEQPFKVIFELTLSALLPAPGMTRLVRLMIQHLQPTPAPPASNIRHPTRALVSASSLDVSSPRAHANRNFQRDVEPPESGSPTMSPKRGVFNFGLGLNQTLTESLPFNHNHTAGPPISSPDTESRQSPTEIPTRPPLIRLPPPFSSSIKSRNILPLGASVVSLPPFQLIRSQLGTSTSEISSIHAKAETIREFECTFIPMRKGLANVGGLRVLLVEDREVEEANNQDDLVFLPHVDAEAKVLREWDAVGEVWIAG